MQKLSVYLAEAEPETLRSRADAQGRSQATVLREALAAYDEQHFVPAEFAFIGSAEGDGLSVAEIPEEELRRGFGEW